MRRETIQTILQAVLGFWLLWIVGQYVLKAGTADRLLAAQLQATKALGFEALVTRVGQGYTRQTITEDGKTYWRGSAVTELKGVHGAEGINQLTAHVYVHYLRVVPLLPWTLGPSAKVTMTVAPPPPADPSW